MKLSSYLIIAAAVAQILFSVGAVCFVGIFMRSDFDTLHISHKLATRPVGKFSSVKFSIKRDAASRYALNYNDFDCTITESDSIASPTISFNAELEKAISFKIVEATLTIEFDYAKLSDQPDKLIAIASDSDDLLPICLTVPRGMLKSIDIAYLASLSIHDMIAANFDILTTSSEVYLQNCRIANLRASQDITLLSLSGGTIIDNFTLNDTDNNDANDFNQCTIDCSDDSRFGTIVIDGNRISALNLSGANYSTARLANANDNISVKLTSDVVINKAK